MVFDPLYEFLPSTKTFISGLEAIKIISESFFSLSIIILIPILLIKYSYISNLNSFLYYWLCVLSPWIDLLFTQKREGLNTLVNTY